MTEENYQKFSVLTGYLGGDANPGRQKFEYRHASTPPGPSDIPMLTASVVPPSPLPKTIFPTAISLR
jgi:hypothetical protein